MLGAVRQVVIARGDFSAGRGNAVGTDTHLRHHARQRVVHGGQRFKQLTKLIFTLGSNPGTQVALRNTGSQRVGTVQRLTNGAHQPGRSQRDQRDHHRQSDQYADTIGLAAFLGLVLHIDLSLLLHLDQFTLRSLVVRHQRQIFTAEYLQGFIALALVTQFARTRARVDNLGAQLTHFGQLSPIDIP